MNGQIQPLYIRPGEYAGEIIITVPITYNGAEAVDTTVRLSIYEAGSMLWSAIDLWWHGSLIKDYDKRVHFEPGEAKAVEFTHTVVPAGTMGETKRDVGVGIYVEGEEDSVATEEFDDVYQVTGGGLEPVFEQVMQPMMAMMMMAMMAMVVMPMMSE